MSEEWVETAIICEDYMEVRIISWKLHTDILKAVCGKQEERDI